MKKNILKLIMFAVMGFVLIGSTGCSQKITSAIEHRNLDVQAKMTNSIFLDPIQLEKNNTIYVRVTNTSDYQEIDFNADLKQKLESKGYKITNKPSEAGYIVQANVLFMGKSSDAMTDTGMKTGGLIGILAGSGGGDWRGAAAGGLVGAAVGGLAGAMFSIDSYTGGIDVSIKERVEGGVTGKQVAKLQDGTGTTIQTTREIKTDFQEFRTQIGVTATQTNIDRNEACKVIAQRLTDQIAGFF